MDNLINKWKQTVDNHQTKLKNLREQSIGRSLSHERTAAITASSLLLQSKKVGQNQTNQMLSSVASNNEMTFSLQNQRGRRRRPRIDASSSSSSSPRETVKPAESHPDDGLQNQERVQLLHKASAEQIDRQELIEEETKQESTKIQPQLQYKKEPELFDEDTEETTQAALLDSAINASTMVLDCEDPATLQLVKSLLDLFAGKRHLGQSVADLLLHFNARDIEEKHSLEVQLAQVRAQKDEISAATDIQENKRAELDRQIETAAAQVRQLKEQTQDLENLDQLQMRKYASIKSQQNVLNLLTESQAGLQKASQGLQAAFRANEVRFEEQNAIWEEELAGIQQDLARDGRHR